MAESRSWIAQASCVFDETEARAFNSKVLNVKLQTTFICINGQGMGGLLYPSDADSNTGRPVIGVLRYNHSTLCTPDLANLACTSLKEHKEYPEVVPLYISEEVIQWVATQLFGLDAPAFQI